MVLMLVRRYEGVMIEDVNELLGIEHVSLLLFVLLSRSLGVPIMTYRTVLAGGQI
jgi:hypothetical protein